MDSPSGLQPLDHNLWLMPFPLKALGVDMRRNVAIIRLDSGKILIHSTGPFSTADIATIDSLGETAWMVDVLLRHDTFANEGHWAFPLARYLAPVGFSKSLNFSTEPLIPVPAEWEGEISVQAIEGAPSFSEIVMLHHASRTLIVGDLIFNFTGEKGFWKKCLLHVATVGGHHEPGMTKPFKMAIKDEAAFAASINAVLEWDFDRIIVGHGDTIPSGGKELLRNTLLEAGIVGI